MAAISEWELWACANECLNQHGEDAPIQAAMRADELLKKGDYDGASAWQLIVKRVHQLMAAPVGSLH
jgi:hypothetical protein